MSEKIIDKLLTLTAEELDSYSDFLSGIFHNGIIDDELNLKVAKYLGLEE